MVSLSYIGIAMALLALLVAPISAFAPRGGIADNSAPTNELHDDYSGYALLFDCDGVIVETEEMHRVAYNAAFTKYGLKLASEKRSSGRKSITTSYRTRWAVVNLR